MSTKIPIIIFFAFFFFVIFWLVVKSDMQICSHGVLLQIVTAFDTGTFRHGFSNETGFSVGMVTNQVKGLFTWLSWRSLKDHLPAGVNYCLQGRKYSHFFSIFNILFIYKNLTALYEGNQGNGCASLESNVSVLLIGIKPVSTGWIDSTGIFSEV